MASQRSRYSAMAVEDMMPVIPRVQCRFESPRWTVRRDLILWIPAALGLEPSLMEQVGAATDHPKTVWSSRFPILCMYFIYLSFANHSSNPARVRERPRGLLSYRTLSFCRRSPQSPCLGDLFGCLFISLLFDDEINQRSRSWSLDAFGRRWCW
jgi:hypothetical protein